MSRCRTSHEQAFAMILGWLASEHGPTATLTGSASTHLPTIERPRTRWSWTDDDLRTAVLANTSLAGVLRTLGYAPSGGMCRYMRACIRELELDTSHFLGRRWSRGIS